MPRYKLAFFVPTAHAAPVKRAIFSTGAGTIGLYKNCAFQSAGQGSFLPVDGAKPAIGEIGREETVDELKVEIQCDGEQQTKEAVKEMKKAHPYEEVAYEVYRIEDF
ncbi:hypothetical protein CALVIDRAFT_487852 [Calocera viscosa TUFC12733]|uniref:ATP phosphoribosyltransferase n=1 Tax=Calocera viscosa (strain TUFC12733) TaxID=1330018 RepID=A0A167I2S3_CALVF|nr:hypothetical protein CALVIDRAFT_487852 [Calocera viscosa TUFC12733]